MLNNCARLYRAYQVTKVWKVISDAWTISFRILHKRKSTTIELRPLNLFTDIKRTKDDSKFFFVNLKSIEINIIIDIKCKNEAIRIPIVSLLWKFRQSIL